MIDIIIIGGGPSGANLARILGKKYSVLLLEKSNTEKSCGGLLNEDSRLLLSQMSLAIPKEIMETPQTSILRAIDLDNDLIENYRKDYLNISRRLFESWLLSLASEYSKILLGATFQGAKYIGDSSLKVSFMYENKIYEESCKILVGADGANSTVRKKMFPDKNPKNMYIAMQTHYQKPDNLCYMGGVFYEELTDYYTWFIPKTDSIIVGGAYRDKEGLKQKEEVLRSLLQSRGINLGEKIKRDGSFLIRPLDKEDFYHGNGNVVLIGEAGGLISPSSAEGVSYALRSSYFLGKAILENYNDYYDDYVKYFDKEVARINCKKLKSKAMFNTSMRNMAIISKIGRIKPLR